MNIKLKTNYLKFFKYLLILILFYIFSKAEIYSCSPFSISLLFALMWTGFSPIIISVEYLICSISQGFSLQNLYIALTAIALLLIVFAIHKKLKYPLNLGLICFYSVLSQITQLYYFISTGVSVSKIVVYFILLVISLIIFVMVFQVTLLRGLYYKTTLNESIAFCYFAIIAGLGLAEINFLNISTLKLVATILSLFLCLIRKNKEAIFLVISLGLGSAITTFDCTHLAEIVIIVLASNIFAPPHKYKVASATILVDLAFCLYFYPLNTKILIEILPCLLGCTIAVCLPDKLIKKLQDKFYVCENEMNMRNIVNLTRKNLHRKFNELSNIFNEMKAIHLNLIKEELNHEQVVNMLTNELMKTMCKDCLDKQKCYRGLGTDAQSVIARLVEIALKKGKISLLDIPSNLSTRCSMVNLLIGKINQIVHQYSQFVGMKKDINNVKYLLAEQLGAVSQIMLNLGDEIDKNISFDSHTESQIINELLAENIVCGEVLIYNEQDKEIGANLIIKGENAYNPTIEKILSEKLKTQMKVVKVQPIDVNGFYSVNLAKDNNFEIIFGLSNCTKVGSEVSGDTHSLIRLGNNKFLLALCDGMGSGETANRTSALTISLIENFYKAGFSNDMVIASVNKLLAINNQENYATLDLCLIDLNKELVDFIKIGSPYSFVKHEAELEVVEGGALPIGVLENISPAVHHTYIDTKSMIIMATDGITDAFKDTDEMADYIKGLVSNNPQTIAQAILDEAVRRNDNVVKDDMTVLVARTFRKNN